MVSAQLLKVFQQTFKRVAKAKGLGKSKGFGKSQGMGKGRNRGKGKGKTQTKDTVDVQEEEEPVVHVNKGLPRTPGPVRRPVQVGGSSASGHAQDIPTPLPPSATMAAIKPDPAPESIPLPTFGAPQPTPQSPIVDVAKEEEDPDISSVTLRRGKGAGQQLAEMTPGREEPAPPSREGSRSRSRSRSRSSNSSSITGDIYPPLGSILSPAPTEREVPRSRSPTPANEAPPPLPVTMPRVMPGATPMPPQGIYSVLGVNNVYYTLERLPFDAWQRYQIQRICQVLHAVMLKPDITRMEVGYLTSHLLSLTHTPPASAFANVTTTGTSAPSSGDQM